MSDQRRVILAIDPDSHLLALYLDGALVWDFGPYDPCHGPLGTSTGLDDALEALFEGLGVGFATLHCRPVSTKTWTDYGWEHDAEWPQRLGDATLVVEPEFEPVDVPGAAAVAGHLDGRRPDPDGRRSPHADPEAMSNDDVREATDKVAREALLNAVVKRIAQSAAGLLLDIMEESRLTSKGARALYAAGWRICPACRFVTIAPGRDLCRGCAPEEESRDHPGPIPADDHAPSPGASGTGHDAP